MPFVLVDDAIADEPFDLPRLFAARGGPRLAAVVRPLPADEGAVPASAAAAAAIAEASARTAGARVAAARFRIVASAAKNGAASEVPAAALVDALVALAAPPFAVLCRVTHATLAAVEALHADPRTQPLLKCGVTGCQLDARYNLARKLLRDGKIHYHEHTLSLARVLPKRLRAMMAAHGAAAPPAAPADAEP